VSNLAEILHNPESVLYFYKAYCKRIVDGDTVEIDWYKNPRKREEDVVIRFLGVNTPERKRDGYQVAKDYTAAALLGREIIIRTKEDKEDDFGRLLATVYYRNKEGQWINLNDELLEKNLAVVYVDRH
jgi:micrococcal nuclease